MANGADLGDSTGFGGAKNMIGDIASGQEPQYGFQEPMFASGKFLPRGLRRGMRKQIALPLKPKMPRTTMAKIGKLPSVKGMLGRRRGLPIIKSKLPRKMITPGRLPLPKIPPYRPQYGPSAHQTKSPYGEPAGTGGY